MNQILETNLNNKKSNLKKLTIALKFQLFFSIILIIIIAIYAFFNIFRLYEKEKYSSKVLNNYNITRLYSNLLSDGILNTNQNSSILGIIEIAKINICYPIFSNCSDELLKISPCKFYGPKPGQNGNLCIAGHNYDNDKFFSRLNNLDIHDEIILYDNYNNKYSYYIYNIYEVKTDNLSPIYSYDDNYKQLTLITCNNLNNNRIIVKALCNK